MSKEKKKISRRKFLVRGGLGTIGVLAVGTYLMRNPIRRKIAEVVDSGEGAYIGNTDDPMIWFEITENNTVILHSPKVEMGQGTFTGLAQIAAEELGVNMTQISVTHAQSASGNLDKFATGGSNSISGLWSPLRELAATMRAMLKAEAAKKLNVAIATLKVADGIITANDKSMSFTEIASGVTEWEVPDTPVLKETSAFKYIGKPIPRIDLKAKVFGESLFGMDATMPNMLYGAVVRPDKIGAVFLDADVSVAESMPGVVKVIQEPDFVGVVATSRMEAENAKNAIRVNWKTDKVWQTKDIEALIKVGAGEPIVIQTEGDAEDILEEANTSITAEYTSPLGAHAQMEPNGAVASVIDGKATVMMSTQVIGFTRGEIADRLDIDEDDVNIIPTYLGGGFGRRLHTPNAMQAAVLSKAVGKPVKCFLNRKEEFQHDTFRPPTHHVLKASLDTNGNIEAIEHNVSSGDVMFGSPLLPKITHTIVGADVGAWRGGMIQYRAIPNYSAVSWRVKLPFATSWWRSLGLLANTFAIESFMDELAVSAKKNPAEFRLTHIQDDTQGFRLKEVIKAAVKASGYSDDIKNGRAMGFAASTDAGTPCAQVVEVSVENNEIKVHKVTCAMDPGLVINPDQVRAQCEGAIIMGMSASMHEQMFVEDGELSPTIYGPYEMALMRHAPKEIDVVLVQNSDKPGAVGEPPIGPIGAAVANAVFRLTGTRLRNMPLKLS